MMNIHTVHAEDDAFVRAVARKVLDAYDGRGIDWVHPVDSEIWKINSGQRAGVVGIELDGRRCCVKLFYDDRLRARVRNSLGLSKAKRAYTQALKLKRFNVGCPDMIGLVREGVAGPFLVVSELCDYASRTDHYIQKYGINSELVKCFAEFVRALHGQGISHVDFSLRNTMVVVDDCNIHYTFLLLDLEDVRFQSALLRSRRLDNLLHLLERAFPLVPIKWRVLFLKDYLQNEDVREWVDALNALLKKYPSKYSKYIFI